MTAQDVLNALGYPDAELSILIVDDDEISSLNSRYLHRNKPTNVIAFPMLEGEFPDVADQMLGDVVISVDTTEREAVEGNVDFETRFNELMVHGVLHLLGYDHEQNEKQAREMEEMTRRVLSVLATNEKT